VTPEHLETDPETVLDPGGYGETSWGRALSDGDSASARTAFVSRLREGPVRTKPETDIIGLRERWYGDGPGAQSATDPDAATQHYHVGAYDIGHQFDGAIDWFYDASAEAADAEFTKEWQLQLNRHNRWVALATAYGETGDTTYAETFETELRGWLAQCPRPSHSGNRYPSAWRTIEAGIRAGWVWPFVFETFRRSRAVSDEALWLWICSFRDHGYHLLNHVTTGNWKTMEANGLTHVGAMFPELDGADTFLSTGVDRMVGEIERQFYPDGLQTELAPGYADVAVTNAYSALEVAATATENAVHVPRRSLERFAEIARAYGTLAAPNGETPPLHDSEYLDIEPAYEELEDDGHPPWEADGATVLPWGGYGILRSEDRYAMLDAGPYGTGHQHQDTMQVVGFDRGEWLLADPGCPQYTDAESTHHIRSAAGHNLVLLDGQTHSVRPEIQRAAEPLPMAVSEAPSIAATAATRSFETVDGDAVFDHERVLCDVSCVGWVVFDRLVPRDDGDHHFEWIWQSPSEWTIDDVVAVAGDGSGPTLRVEPVATREWTATTVSASTDPYRGWQPLGEDREPNPLPTLRIECAGGSGPVEMITLLSPTGARLVGANGDGARAVTVAGADGDRTDLVYAGGEQIERLEYEGPDGAAALAIDDHALCAGDRPT